MREYLSGKSVNPMCEPAFRHLVLLPLLVLMLAGCERGSGVGASDGVERPARQGADSKDDPGRERSPGKPSAPVDIGYRVLGTPLVGQPVAIELTLASPLAGQQLRLSYFINDSESLRFADSQPREIELSIDADEGSAARQVTVVPQREGRLYLNVTAEIETEIGFLLKSMAIPLSVGYAEGEPAVNGRLEQTADGETVVSMPAAEN